MKFCPVCEKRLIQTMPTRYTCPQCGYIVTDIPQKTVSSRKTEPIVTSPVETEVPILPTIRVECSQCANLTAYYWTANIGKDEDVLVVTSYRCTQCGHKWSQGEH